jgi:hypothetical protein
MPAWKPIASFWMAMLVGVFAYARPAVAAPVFELEQGGTETNNTIATAQFIPASAFTSPTQPDAQGFPTANISGVSGETGCDVLCRTDRDFYSFFANGGELIADLDACGGCDHTLSLFNSARTLIAFNDDGHEGDSDPHDPFLGRPVFFSPLILPGPGVYLIEVSQFGEGPDGPQPHPFSLSQKGYFLQLSIQNPIPEASTLFLVSVGMSVLLVMRRRPRLPSRPPSSWPS